ncbi:hypothetical protein PVAP13_8NG148700 [Panicum virgatum]|uniref:Major facilitator superfamily (MFS) profile domain-containing protein n=1 Tax=Panicum virgatum TaxID=38727 RepID=A0A8T0PBK9_PANVG|nr:hypothetical protein PVAP13_8NG148700 [Panicum virgatum]
MTTILMGYNQALLSSAQLFIREDLGLSDAQIEVLAGSINVFMLASILAAGWAADVLARRGTLVLANVSLMAGELANGARRQLPRAHARAMLFTSVYNAEISPPSMRGFLSSFLDMFISVGLLLSYVSNYAFAGFCGVLAMPESPRWLVMCGRHAEARAEIKQQANADDGGGGSVWKELLVRPSASVRRILICVVGVHFFQQASGIDAIVLYSPLVFRQAGMLSNMAALGATVGVGVVKMCFVLVAALFSDSLGRRPLLLTSAAGVVASMAALGAALSSAGSAASVAATVASVLAFMAAFSVGLGPLAGTYNAEVMPLRLRAQGTSLGMVVNRLTSALVSMTFISLADAITMPGCFFLYAGVAAAACVFVYARMPETRGRSLEDMDELFAK